MIGRIRAAGDRLTLNVVTPLDVDYLAKTTKVSCVYIVQCTWCIAKYCGKSNPHVYSVYEYIGVFVKMLSSHVENKCIFIINYKHIN